MIVLFAIFLSLSRGGTIAMIVALVTTMGLFYRADQVSYRTFFVAGGLVVLMLCMLSLYGYEKISSRLDDFSAGSLEEIDSHKGRRSIWAANVASIQAGGFFGSGAGSHREIYRIYMEKPCRTEYTHAENGYLQLATENGILGACVLLLAIGSIAAISFQAIRSQNSPRIALCVSAVIASLTASLVHSVVDFVWFIPACLSMTLLLVACAVNLSKLKLEPQKDRRTLHNASTQGQVWASKQWWLTAGVATLLAGVWMSTVMVGPAIASLSWDRYLRASIANAKLTQFRNLQEEDSETAASHEMYINEMMAELQEHVRWYPQSARAHLRLANRHIQQFEQEQHHNNNAMEISQIRDAAMASDFTSSQELRQWLTRAFGGNSQHLYQAYGHAWQAIRLNPLQGQAYLYLANLCFLAGHQVNAIDAYLDQSLRVRPQDSDILFEVGKQHLLLGRVEQTVDYWTRAFDNDSSHQRQIVQYMAGQVAAATFVEYFHPDWRTLAMIWQRYREVGQPEDLLFLLHYSASLAEADSQNQKLATQRHIWLALAMMQSHVDQADAALISLQKAYQVAPSNYYTRHALGFALLKAQQYQFAEPHLRWCLARKPRDKQLQDALIRVAKKGALSHVLIAQQPERQFNKMERPLSPISQSIPDRKGWNGESDAQAPSQSSSPAGWTPSP
ncbi:MAG: O-antigen ligase family protein [Pirellulales bacterium]